MMKNQIYSKIRMGTTPKSRSIDFSDDSYSPPELNLNLKPNPIPQSKIQELRKTHDSIPKYDCEDDAGERFGVILSRARSVSSCSSQRFGSENAKMIPSAVKKAFSMRRSSSVAEGYYRVHDQCESLSPSDDYKNMQTRSRKKRGRVLKAFGKI